MKNKFLNILVMIIITIVSGMAGCGGGGGSSSSDPGTTPVASQTVSGVAATGAPISGTIYLKDSSNPAVVRTTTTNAEGSFSFDVTGLTAPFMLKAVGTSNGQNYTLYSLAGTPGVANVNPLSHLAVVKANGGVDPAALYASLTPDQLQAVKNAMSTVIPQIKTLLQQILAQYGSSTVDFIGDSYVANHSGLDLMFDMIAIVVNNGNLSITSKVNGANILSTSLNGNNLSGQIMMSNVPSLTSQVIGSVYVYPTTQTIHAGSSVTFKAIVIGTTNQSVTWSVVESAGGSITSGGVYTAPSTAGTYHIKATSTSNTSKSGTATVIVSTTSNSLNNVGSVWKTDSTVSPAVTITIGTPTTTDGAAQYYSGSIQCSVLKNSIISFTNMTVSNYIQVYTYYSSQNMLIGAEDSNYNTIGIIPDENLITTTKTSVSAFVGIMNNTGYFYSGYANLIKQ